MARRARLRVIVVGSFINYAGLTKTSDERRRDWQRGRAYRYGRLAVLERRPYREFVTRSKSPPGVAIQCRSIHQSSTRRLQLHPAASGAHGNPGIGFLQTTDDGTRSTGNKLPASLDVDGDGRSWSSPTPTPTPPPGSRLQLRTRPTAPHRANEPRNTRAARAGSALRSVRRSSAPRVQEKKGKTRCRRAAPRTAIPWWWWWVDRRRAGRVGPLLCLGAEAEAFPVVL